MLFVSDVVIEEELLLLPYYTTLIPEVGCGDLDYLQMQDRISAESGGISASFSAKGKIDDVQDLEGYIVFNGKALARNREALTRLLNDVFDGARFDEKERVRELMPAWIRLGAIIDPSPEPHPVFSSEPMEVPC